MYYDRVLPTVEALYVSRAQQRIAELTVELADEFARNDVDDRKAQLVQELQYSILALKSTDLDWTEDEIQEVMDYYTIEANLLVFGFRSIVFDQICAIPDGYVWATVKQLNACKEELEAYDAYLLSLINQEILDRIAGDANLQAQIDLLGAGTLVAPITAQSTVGGIYEGTVFPIGTTFEALWNALLGVPVVASNFTCDSFVEFVEAGEDLDITSFSWSITGTPVNLRLSDSEGVYTNEPVTGSGFVPESPDTYSKASTSAVVWTLEADNMDPVTFTVKWRFKTYYGKEATADDTLVTVTEAKILAGADSIQDAIDEVTVTADTANGEQGFIAVHKAQAGSDFTEWFVNTANFSDIVSGEFIVPSVDVTVDGETYSVYRWGYRSPLTKDLKLHR